MLLPEPPFQLSPNPGGTLEPSQVIGRDALILRYREVLEGRSLVLAAPRRLGKSSICRRMIAYPAEGWSPHARDLQGGNHPAQLVRWLYDDVQALLSPWRRTAGRAHRLLKALGGKMEFAGVKLELAGAHWADLLDALLDDLDEGAGAAGTRVVLFWDEFPLFLGDVARGGLASEAMLLLDRLRAARSRHRNIRMVMYGSINFEEVIATLRRAGYANDPFNDTAKERVPPLDPDGALVLARALLRGAQLPSADLAVLPDRLAALSEGHPFVLQHLVHGLRHSPDASESTAVGILDRLLDAESDPLELRHYLERLSVDVAAGAAEMARALLDRLAVAGELPSSALVAGFSDPDAARDALQRLRQESYVVRSGDNVKFTFNFLRSWWMRERAL